ncbi:hypothetical protein [Cyanobium sp. ATX 6F1]|uniref:hypothetical protein n=1 Tax=Cyanobium sp. ATX 6F1 TaxID=2823702 RepID=UPI0020CF7E32|nr:hypothetical protein [Cyanobium sp. ATX 6F1]MCP9917719.1 hypothetical protein [Cyanobium sp. ATX 6F1]
MRLAGCRYRLRERQGSPYLTVYETKRDGRALTAKAYLADDDEAVEALAGVLLAASKDLKRGGPGLDWSQLDGSTKGGLSSRGLSWGEIRRVIKDDIAPGGPKARDRNPFSCFCDKGYFGVAFSDDQEARAEQLEQFCLYTPASLLAHRTDSSQPLVSRTFNTSVFYGTIQMANYLAKKGISIATPELREKLEGLKASAGRPKTPAPRYIPRSEELQAWLDQLQQIDPLRGWVMAMIATFGLRPHEIWHIEQLPGQCSDPTFLQISAFEAGGDSATKTGHRFAIALPEAWLKRFRLDDLQHGQKMLKELRKRYPVKAAEAADGTLQFWNNSDLGRIVAHWLKNSGREDREIPVKLYGSHQPRSVPGKTKPKARRGRCKAYDLRHAWAIRAREMTTWSTSLKASSMGHSEAIHAKRYLAELTAEQMEQGMVRQKALDEGAQRPSRESLNLEGITPEILARARAMAALKNVN